MSDALSASEFASTASHLMAAKMFSLAACVMLFYDMAITFGDEVERIWLRPFTPMTVLWTLNRYLSPLGYIVIIVCKRHFSFHDPWSKSVCDRFVLFPEALKVVTSFTIGVIFILRLYAIYSRSLTVAVMGGIFLVAELATKIWSFTDGTRLDLPEGLVGCILIGRTHLRFAFTWIAELVFDSIIFFATVYRVVQHNRLRHGTEKNLLDRILHDGVLYFAVIFAANLITVLIFMLAPLDIKAINASFSTLITNLMVSRLILNLRERSDGRVIFQSGMDVSEVEWAPQYERDPDSQQTLFGLRHDLYALQRQHTPVH